MEAYYCIVGGSRVSIISAADGDTAWLLAQILVPGVERIEPVLDQLATAA
jgi:hypothetical protein